ncbi:MAG: ester cyclase [Gramella sp.]|nr:ester cyclase [Christiangramia sp.]
MKNFMVILVALVFGGYTVFSQSNNVDKDIKMYTQVWDEVINKGEIDKINNENFHEDITMVYSPENVVGIEAFKAHYNNFIEGFSEREFTVKQSFGNGDNIVKHWRFKGKHTGNFFGIPATGKQIDVEGVTLVKMKDGKIAREHDFMDNSVFLQQLGLMSDPGNLKIIDNLYKAFSAGDIPAVLSLLDDEIVWNEAEGNAYADGNPYVGPDAVLNGVFARTGADHEYFKLSDIKLHEMSNNQVLSTLRYNAKVKKNSNTYDVQVAHLWTLNDGKIIAFQQYVDTKQLDEAIGD